VICAGEFAAGNHGSTTQEIQPRGLIAECQPHVSQGSWLHNPGARARRRHRRVQGGQVGGNGRGRAAGRCDGRRAIRDTRRIFAGHRRHRREQELIVDPRGEPAERGLADIAFRVRTRAGRSIVLEKSARNDVSFPLVKRTR
jgi:hypothetical protein